MALKRTRNQTSSPWRDLPIVLAVILSILSTAAASATTPADSASTSNPSTDLFQSLRLVGVIQTKALIAMTGMEEELLLAEGDMLGGYTIEKITRDRVEMKRGDEKRALNMRHLRWIKADPKAKIAVAQPTPSPVETSTTPARIDFKKPPASLPPTLLASSPRPTFIHPMRGLGEVTSGFGRRGMFRTNTGYGSLNHEGIDIAARSGTTIRASAAGIVTRVGYDNMRGNYVCVSHSGGYETRYLHLKTRSPMKLYQNVKAGQEIGREGSTGNSTGPHLHFEIRKNDVAYNPANYISSLK